MIEAINIESYSQGLVAVNANTSVQTVVLDRGYYDVWSDVICYIKVDEQPTGVTASNGHVLYANNVVTVWVNEGRRFGVIGSAAGTFRYHQVGE